MTTNNATATLADHVRDWSPGPVTTSGATSSWAVDAFAALLDTDRSGTEVPPLWHWFGFLDHPRADELGADGHPAHGHFLPPLPDRRRMIAGGRLEITAPMRVDEQLQRRSALTRCAVKSGRSGEMALVTVRHEFLRAGAAVVVEEQDVVYRSQPAGQPRGLPADDPGANPPRPSPAALELVPDEAMLFRFSALTYNTHRIHYDLPYVTGVEGYPGLVVHGPLLALLLLEIPRRRHPERPVRRFSYRLSRPAFAGHRVVADLDPAHPAGDTLALAAGGPGAPPSITGTVDLEPSTHPQDRSPS